MPRLSLEDSNLLRSPRLYPALLALTIVSPLHAQEPTKLPTFAVVSVRPSPPDARPHFTVTPDGLSESNNTVLWAIVTAYGLRMEDRVLNAPSWLGAEAYDIQAKVDPADAETLRALPMLRRYQMLRQVLEDRFQLKYHYETKNFPNYALIIAKGGPRQITASKPSDLPPKWTYSAHYRMVAERFTMETLCNIVVSTESQRLTVDQSGLKGKYDFILEWSREDDDGHPVPPGSTFPNIFIALENQLGLKLIPITVPTQVLVIDRIERPSEN